MNAAPTREQVVEALRHVMDPELGRSLVDLGMVRDVRVEDGGVQLTLAVTTMACPLKDHLATTARAAIAALPGVREVQIETVQMTEQERLRILSGTSEPESNQIQRVVAVSSGKAGAGTSTVTALLAAELARRGRRVGILDADVTGPSIPDLFGLESRSMAGQAGMQPVRSRLGIKVISTNLLMPAEDSAVDWRGPLVARAIRRFWSDVRCWPLDNLLVDLPPGTSDAALTVMESLPLSGLVLVTTPQDSVARVARKSLRMVQQLGVPALGVVENMSHFVCPDTEHRHELFGPGHGEELARLADAPLLARLPLDPAISRLSDEGRIEEYASEATGVMAQAVVVELAVAAAEGRGAAAEVRNVR